MDNKTIIIDAGGEIFKTLKTTLTHSSVYFQSKLARWTQEDEVMFLDLDPEDFRQVLNYLRDSSNQLPRQNLLDYFGIETQRVIMPEKPQIYPLKLDDICTKLPNRDFAYMTLFATGIYDAKLNEPNLYGPNTLFDRSHTIHERSIILDQRININYLEGDILSKMAIKFRMETIPPNFDKFNLINRIRVHYTNSKCKSFEQKELRIYQIIQKLDKFDEVEQQTHEFYIHIPIEHLILIREQNLELIVESNMDFERNLKDLQFKFTCKSHFLEKEERSKLIGASKGDNIGFRSLEWQPVILSGVGTTVVKKSNQMYLNTYRLYGSDYITKCLYFYLPEDIIIYQLTFGCGGLLMISLDQIDLERYQVEHNFDYRTSQIFALHLQPHLNFSRCDNIEITLITNQKDLGDMPGLSQFYHYQIYNTKLREWKAF
jgi:hypothetical protein